MQDRTDVKRLMIILYPDAEEAGLLNELLSYLITGDSDLTLIAV